MTVTVDDAIVVLLRARGFPISHAQLLEQLHVDGSRIATKAIDDALVRLLLERRIRSPFNQHYDIEEHAPSPQRFTRTVSAYARHTASTRISPPPASAGCMESPTRKVEPAACEIRKRGKKPKLNEAQTARLLELVDLHAATTATALCAHFGISFPTYMSTLKRARAARERDDAC